MNVIQEITSQTSAGTSATAESIGHLSEMASDLRDYVAGFKQPEEMSLTVSGTGEMPAVGRRRTSKNKIKTLDVSGEL
jgi:hypothetical protein